jgi:hypothetical protein
MIGPEREPARRWLTPYRAEGCVRKRCTSALLLGVVAGASLTAAELQPRTVAAFDRYVRATESSLKAGPFLYVDRLPPSRRAEALAMMKRGLLSIEAPRTLEGGREIDVPGGIVHHWVGTAFVPGATLDQALRILQDYDRHDRIYAPTVARSKLLSHEGDRYRFFLRFRMKKVITVVVNSEHDARFTREPDRVEGWIHSTRIAEVENPDEPGEREKPVGQDGGYLWRLNTYWRLLLRDGGLYIQCESVSLTRGIPLGFGWLVGPFVTSIPKESLTFTLETTRKQLGEK